MLGAHPSPGGRYGASSLKERRHPTPSFLPPARGVWTRPPPAARGARASPLAALKGETGGGETRAGQGRARAHCGHRGRAQERTRLLLRPLPRPAPSRAPPAPPSLALSRESQSGARPGSAAPRGGGDSEPSRLRGARAARPGRGCREVPGSGAGGRADRRRDRRRGGRAATGVEGAAARTAALLLPGRDEPRPAAPGS